MRRRAALAFMATLALGLAPGLLGPREGAASPERRTITVPFPQGALQLSLPEGWESNPRLAQDNTVSAFLHPAGMTIGDNIPVWVLIEPRKRTPEQGFETEVRTILMEGVPFGFVARDSLFFKTSDGRRVASYRFQTSEEGWERGLAFLDLPEMILLFRQHAADSASWGGYRDEIDAMLRSLRFLPRQASSKATPR